MFSSLASYLLGSHPQEPELSNEAVAADVRLRAVDGDDDWVLIEKSDNERSGSAEKLPTLELAISAVPRPFRALTDVVDYHPLTRTSSSSSLPCLSFEESWFVTPPPCFTSEGPVHMETSPLENLLIEHPSMSVYQHSSSTHGFLPLPRHRSGSTGTMPDSPTSNLSDEDSDPPCLTEHVVQNLSGQRQAVYSLHHQQEKQCLQIRSAQKLRQRRACQLLKRNHLERSNKAREINSRNKCQRRSDHMQRHSGANNNRKC